MPGPPWPYLPQELLSTIADFLTTDPIDILAFRAVCKTWYSASPSPPPFNLSHHFPIVPERPTKDFDIRFYVSEHREPTLSVTSIFKVHHDQSSWVLFADQLTPGKLIIRKPFTKICYSMPFNFPNYLDVPNVRVNEIARYMNLSFHGDVNYPPNIWSNYTHKVVIDDYQTAAYALFSTGKLGMAKFRDWVTDKWKPVNSIAGDADSRIDDVVSFKGRILAVDRIARLYDVGTNVHESLEIVPYLATCGTKRKRLVVSKGQLYLVHRYNDGDDESEIRCVFKVYRLNRKGNNWVEVSSIGDQVFCIGLDFSFSASVMEMGNSFGKNCVVFKRGCFKNLRRVVHYRGDYDDTLDNHDDDHDDIYDEDDSSKDLDIWVWHMNNPTDAKKIGSYSGYANALWPPPAWILPKDMPKRLGDVKAAIVSLFNHIPDQSLMKALDYQLKSKDFSVMEPALTSGTDHFEQGDISEIWRRARILERFLSYAIGFYERFTDVEKNSTSSRQLQNTTITLQNKGSFFISYFNNGHHGDDRFSSANLHALIFHLEESIRRLMDIFKGHLMLFDHLKLTWESSDQACL